MPRRALMGGIRRPFNYGSGDLDPVVLIQCVSGRDPMDYEFWFHELSGIYHEVHPTSRVDITAVIF